MSDVIPGGIQKYNIILNRVNKNMLQLTKAKIVELINVSLLAFQWS